VASEHLHADERRFADGVDFNLARLAVPDYDTTVNIDMRDGAIREFEWLFPFLWQH
jgi:hypothetical protein